MRRIFIIAVVFSACLQLMAQPPEGKAWIQTFNEEFSGSSLAETQFEFGFGWGSQSGAFDETNKVDHVSISNGHLRIQCGKDLYSGAVNTKKTFSQKYGYWEARIKVAKGMGFLNAFWAKDTTDAWPPEIDFAEILGRDVNTAYYTIWKDGPNSSGNSTTTPDLSEDFHVFGFEWNEGYFIWYFDSKPVRYLSTQSYLDYFNNTCEEMYTMLNVHIGHSWPGWPDNSTPDTAFMEVDWVRAYQFDNNYTISLVNPGTGAVFEVGSDISIEPEIVSNGVEIEKVEFWANNELINEDNQTPYQYNWEDVSEGRYAIFAKAIDTSGRLIFTEPNYITVGNIDNNLILNPFFANETNNWNLLQVSNTTTATFDVTNQNPIEGIESGLISIIKPGTNVHDIQLRQWIFLEKGENYNLTFKSKASTEKEVNLTIRSVNEKYYILQKILTLNNDIQEYSFDFKSNFLDYTGQFVISVGGGNACDILIDSIFLHKKTTSAILEYEEGINKLFIYPNIAINQITVRFPIESAGYTKLLIINNIGMVVQEEIVHNYEINNGYQLDCSSLKRGLYYLQLETPTNQVSKFIKN